MEISKHDWKLFREKLPDWQEAYMDKLNREYMAILTKDGLASEKFWELNRRIKFDRQNRGVSIRLIKRNMIFDIAAMINDGAISPDELDGFSPELVEAVQYLCGRYL